MRFRLTPRSMTLDDTELLPGRILSEFCGISQIWEPTRTTAKRMKVDPYCSPLDLVFGGVLITLISQGVPPLGGQTRARVVKTRYWC